MRARWPRDAAGRGRWGVSAGPAGPARSCWSSLPRSLGASSRSRACGGAHHWAREIASLGHEVKLIPPAYVKPFVKRNKNDAVDAEAICEAAQRPSMRYAAIKTEAQQAAGMVFRTRRSAGAPAHAADQCDQRASDRVRMGSAQGALAHQRARKPARGRRGDRRIAARGGARRCSW